MNFKTSVILTVVLVVLAAGLFTLRARQQGRTPPERPISPTAKLEQPLFEQPPENVVKIACTRAGQPPWRFERTNVDDEDAQAEWRLTEPIEGDSPSYMVDSIVRRIANLNYQVRYAPGDPEAITPQQAGLESPKVTVQLEDKDGTSFTVHIGRPASGNETFVRLAGADDIYVVKTALDRLLRERVEEYRDKSMLKFNATDATTVEITHRPQDGEPVHYRLVKHDRDKWVFEEPFGADADDKAVDAAIRAVARLRAGDWVDHQESPNFGRFGLNPPELDVQIVCEEKVTVPVESGEADQEDAETGEEQDQESEEPETIEKIETKHYHLLVAGRSPLGKDTTVYAKLGDDSAVATIAKTTAEKITPVVTKWRNMKVCRNSVANATRIRVRSRDGQSASFIRNDEAKWVFEESGRPAEGPAVKELIDKIGTLRALAFVDDIDADDPKYGLAPPYTEIAITIPGREEPERIAVGDPTDETGKGLYYVRYGDSTSLAKVRATDVALLKRSSLNYENRGVIDLAPSALESIDLTRPNSITGDPEALTLEKHDSGSWRLTVPVDAKTDGLTTTSLVTTLANLRAESVVARSGALAEYGLDNATVQVTISYQGPPVIEGSTAAEADVGPLPPTLEMFILGIAEHNHKIYAKRSDSPTIYKLRRTHYDAFLADYHTKEVWDIDQAKIVSVAVTSGDETYRFDSTDDGWIYAAEPDLPIDTTKVANLVLQIQDLKLERFVAYGVADLATCGLDKPAKKVTIETEDGRKATLLVSRGPCLGDRGKNVCAVMEGSANVFLLSQDTVSRFDISIEEFEMTSGS